MQGQKIIAKIIFIDESGIEDKACMDGASKLLWQKGLSVKQKNKQNNKIVGISVIVFLK